MSVHHFLTLALSCLLITPVATAFGHDILAKYIQHSAHLTINARHLDLELDLTFFEEQSAKERQAMDADGDGLISSAEKETYLARLVPTLSRSVMLRVGVYEVAFTPLYEPELDLLANNKTGPAHHRLRLFLFASTPPPLRSGDEIIIEDRLWSAVSSFGTLRTEGRDGFELQSESSLDPLMPGSDSKIKCFRVKCRAAPLKNAASFGTAITKTTEEPTSRASLAGPSPEKPK